MQRPRTTWHFPADLVQRVALFFPDSVSFFHFLAAFAPYDVLGGLQHMWALHHTCGIARDTLWPRLRLDRSPAPVESLHFQAIFQYYSDIDIVGAFDLTWLHAAMLPPSAAIHFTARYLMHSDFPDEFDIYAWTRLPLVSLDVPLFDMPDALDVLAHLPHLTTLRVGYIGAEYAFELESLLQLVSTSTSITSLTIQQHTTHVHFFADDTPVQITPAMLSHLIHWLRHRPVRHLAFYLWDFEDVESMMHVLYDALANCATMTTLEAYESNLTGLAGHTFTRPLTWSSLVLQDCPLSTADTLALSTGLSQSSIASLKLVGKHMDDIMQVVANSLPHMPYLTHLELHGPSMNQTDMEALWQSLGRANVTSLTLSGHKMFSLVCQHLPHTPSLRRLRFFDKDSNATICGDTRCGDIAHAIAQSQVTFVDLSHNHIGDVGATQLAHGLQRSRMLRHLVLDHNSITAKGASVLVQSLCRNRVDPIDRLSLRQNKIHPNDVDMLQNQLPWRTSQGKICCLEV
ncbi:Aste57867_19733 [Aphanomyces stellatus]|uniref:Aste57867_19733 protein n=1 Tax=Aphanomyces stellatus TaxID=120398 RepID=A0A485LHV1_9STRA|nr:hypothetical protein As57867_019668 [Aphanomyces stellatus]VFT96431.1 Aste57867_19733 [Aphanomyces stellatus]